MIAYLGKLPVRNYLRVRGEYEIDEGLNAHVAELPPRTRRILVCFAHLQQTLGTTSAYAENTEPTCPNT